MIEALLGVVVLSLIVTLFIPLHYQMYNQQLNRKQALHASAAMLEAVKHQGIATIGTYRVDGISYHWQYDDGRVCVVYQTTKRHERCL